MGIQGIQHKWEVWGSWRGIWKGRGIQEGGVQERVWEGLGGGFKKGGPGPTQIQHVGRV